MLEYDEIKAQFEVGQKINFDLILQKVIQGWDHRPKIMLHSCCAPCSTYTLEYLTQHADVTVYFDNPNIHPRMEYERRKLVQERFISDFNEKTGNHVQFMASEYKPSDWLAVTKSLKDEPEGGARCHVCYQFRLERVAKKAQELGFDYFGSALTISPQKNAQVINEEGLEIQHFYSVAYLPSDFKKRGGYARSVQMSKDYNVYRQCYCGCLFAAKQQGIDLAQVNREATAFVNAHQHENFDHIQFHIESPVHA